jgi:ferrochelatase
MQKKTAVLLVNLGTPDSPKPKDVYKYLIEFLTDGRVIDKPWGYRQLLVRGLIVPFRYRQSAKSYKEIWTKDGSPLMVNSKKTKDLLQDALGSSFHVELAMRYQNPSIESALAKLMKNRVEHLIVVPLFPQYASATTGSVHQKILEIISTYQVIPKLTLINNFATNPLYIETIANIATTYDIDTYDHILFSFHGLPKRHLIKANPDCLKSSDCCKKTTCSINKDCYSAQCHQTAFAIVNKLKIDPNRYSITFQSRLGRDPWLNPFTIDRIKELRSKGVKRILVFCPSFVSDCLETIHEIGIEYADEFIKEGGTCLHYVKSLNDHPKWIETLQSIIKSNV